MICLDLQPLSIVEDKGFIAYVRELNKNYQFPTRKTIRNSLLPKLFNDVKAQLKIELASHKNVAISPQISRATLKTKASLESLFIIIIETKRQKFWTF